MSSSFSSLQDAQKAEVEGHVSLAQGHYWFVTEDYPVAPEIIGAGNIISNVLDYARYLRAMMTMDPKLLNEKSYETLRKPRSIEQPKESYLGFAGPSTYALGWVVEVYSG